MRMAEVLGVLRTAVHPVERARHSECSSHHLDGIELLPRLFRKVQIPGETQPAARHIHRLERRLDRLLSDLPERLHPIARLGEGQGLTR